MDICDRTELDRVFSAYKPNTVMHLAAESRVDCSFDGPSTFIETNIVGICTLLEASRQYWIRSRKKESFCFRHISTD